MKRTKQLLTRIIFLGCIFSIITISLSQAQTESFCGGITGGGGNPIGYLPPNSTLGGNTSNTPKYIKVYIHVIRRPGGLGGQSDAAVQGALNRLNSDFNPHNIFFVTPCRPKDIIVSEADYLNYNIYCNLFENPSYQYDDGG